MLLVLWYVEARLLTLAILPSDEPKVSLVLSLGIRDQTASLPPNPAYLEVYQTYHTAIFGCVALPFLISVL